MTRPKAASRIAAWSWSRSEACGAEFRPAPRGTGRAQLALRLGLELRANRSEEEPTQRVEGGRIRVLVDRRVEELRLLIGEVAHAEGEIHGLVDAPLRAEVVEHRARHALVAARIFER